MVRTVITGSVLYLLLRSALELISRITSVMALMIANVIKKWFWIIILMDLLLMCALNKGLFRNFNSESIISRWFSKKETEPTFEQLDIDLLTENESQLSQNATQPPRIDDSPKNEAPTATENEKEPGLETKPEPSTKPETEIPHVDEPHVIDPEEPKEIKIIEKQPDNIEIAEPTNEIETLSPKLKLTKDNISKYVATKKKLPINESIMSSDLNL